MRMRVDLAIIIKTVGLWISADVTLVPNRKLHRLAWEQDWRLAATPQTGADGENAAMLRLHEISGRVGRFRVRNKSGAALHHAVERDFSAWIEQVINAKAGLATKTLKRFFPIPVAHTDFVIVITVTAA